MKDKRKSKKKHKKKYESSSDSDSSDIKMQWVEASPASDINTAKKKKKQRKKHAKSSSSDSESEEGKMEWSEGSSSKSKLKKKKKHSKKGHSSSSNSESSDKESRNESLTDTVEKRDTWMNEESFVRTFSKDEIYQSSHKRRAESLKEQREKEEKIQRERELNPHWKNEGTGLPEKETNADSLSLPSTSVGDGGYSWLKKAYYRIQEQAQQEGRSMEEVAVERWGSLSKLTSLIEEAEERMKNHPDWKRSKHQYKDKYSQDNRSSRMKFKKPSYPHESEKTFDSPFQFRKPSNDFESRKVLNKFKSSKKSSDESYMDRKSEYKNSDTSRASHKQYSTNHDADELKIKTSGSRIPAWMKPKHFEDKEKSDNSDSGVQAWKKLKHSENEEISDHSEPRIVKSPVKEVVKEADDMPLIYSENDLNKLAAKQIKAEMMGNTVLAEKLKKQLDEARTLVKEKGFAKQPSNVVEEVVLTKFDSQGQARPIQATQDRVSDYKQKKSSKYFDDDSSYSLKQMFEREKLTTVDDNLKMFVKASGQDDTEKIAKKMSSVQEEERDIGRAIQQHQKHTAALLKCCYCLDQPNMKKHLIVHVGENVYLCLPNFQSMTEGHCLIIPKTHVSSLLSLDENEWREVNDFKNQLRSMFRSDNKSVIFLETSMHLRHFPHAFLECIPVPEEEGDMAPLYFKKAIQESETEWAHNKKLIETSKGLRHSVPKGLPYFYVEFDPKIHAGFAHVIEEEKYFPRNFGKEILGGMLDIDYNYLYKNKKEDPLKKSKEVVDFQKKWKFFVNIK